MLYDLVRASAETTACTKRACERAHDHVDFSGVDILVFGDPAAIPPENAKGPSLVKDKTEFVAEFELDLVGVLAFWSCRLF